MIDRLQQRGTSWVDPTGTLLACHRGKGNAPIGGNFLYEDGHVEWRKFNQSNLKGTVDIGLAGGSWTMYFRPAELNAGPW